MDKNLNNLLMIDQEIGEFFYENNDLSDSELSSEFEKKDYVNRSIKLIKKLSSKNVIELIKRSRYLNSFIDLKKFVKKYPLNKKYLKTNKSEYIEEYRKLQKICFYLSDIAKDYREFHEYMQVLDADNVEDYLLKNMPNEQIYTLASETGLWEEKLYFFSYFKQKK